MACLMASHGYPLGFHPGHVSNRLCEDVHHILPSHGSIRDLVHPRLFNSSVHLKEDPKSTSGLLDSNHLFRIESTSKRPTLIDLQDSALLSFGIAERCGGHEKIMKLLSFKSTTGEESQLLDVSMLYDLIGPQLRISDFPKQPFASYSTLSFQNLIHPTKELYLNEPFFGQLSCNLTDTEINDMVCFYSSKNTNMSGRHTMLVPYFERRRKPRGNSGASKLAATETSSRKSHDKVKEKTSQKKKTNTKACKERDVYSNSYLRACEGLLSIIADRNHKGKNVILTLKKSGPQLPHLLTQISASIAGGGIAVVLSVLCRAGFARVPLCSSSVLSTGLGLGLVWISWAVAELRNTVIAISRSSGKVGEREDEEMMRNLDRNLKDIYVRVAALMAVVVLKVA